MRKTKDEKELIIWVGQDGYYYFQGDYQICEGCKEILNDDFLYIRHWVSKREYHYYSLCINCLKNKVHKKLPSLFTTINKVKYTTQITIDCELAIFEDPRDLRPMKNGNFEMTTFDAADIRTDGAKIIDNTKLSGRQSLEGAKIGMDVQDAIAGKDDILLDNEVNKLLEDAKNSVPLIEEDKKKQLDNQKV
jgi:hypothetical protein